MRFMHGERFINTCVRVLVLTVLTLSIITPGVSAQAKGHIVGRVVDAKDNGYLPGANVYLNGTSRGSVSDRAGEFRIVNVPAGSQEVICTYMGYDDFSTTVNVPPGGTVRVDIELDVNYVMLSEVVVQGIRQGQVKALSQQQNAENIQNVVSKELMERFPDVNSAEVLQRVPAVSIQRDQGEGRYVLVRGTSERLNMTMINGELIPSPEGETRSVALDVVPSGQLASIEVTKAITPEMDGDAIGGAVNLVTKSGFDSDKRILNVTAGAGYSALMEDGIYQAAFTYGDRYSGGDLGLMLSGQFYLSNRGSDNNEMEWGSEDDVNDNEIPWALQNLELRDYIVTRDREGVSANLDYRFNDDNKMKFRTIFNRFSDQEYRRRLRYRPDKGDYNSATDISEAAIERELKDRKETQTIYSFSAHGEHRINTIDLDYKLAYSYAEEEEPERLDTTFELDEDADMALDLSDTDTPQVTVTNLSSGYIHEAGNYVLDEIAYEDNLTTDQHFTANLNLEMPVSLMGTPGAFKFGGKGRFKTKDRENEVIAYGWEGDDDLLLSQFLADDEDTDFMGGDYRVGPSPDPDKLRDFFEDHHDRSGELEGELNHEDSDGANYEATENTYAYYTKLTLNFDNLQFVGGFRHEISDIEYTGYEVLYDEEGDYVSTAEIMDDASFSNFLPMLHLRYKLTPKTNVRAAFTGSIARPHYYDLVPYRIVLSEDEEMSIGNASLEPTTSYNLDLTAEHYFQGVGVVSGGFFYKSLDNIIYDRVFEQEGGPYDGYEVTQPVNGETATLYGFEMNWQQQLTFLPGFWSGFGVYANYTYTDSEADLPGRQNTLPGQAGDVANAAISYERGGFSGRISANYHGSYIDEVGEDDDHDIYYDDHLQIDASFTQRIIKNIRAYANFLNLTDEPLRYYIGTEDRPIQREFYSWWMEAGLKLEL